MTTPTDWNARAATSETAAAILTAAAATAPDDACRDLLLEIADDQAYAAVVYRRTATATAEL
jgi:hypothetical protein